MVTFPTIGYYSFTHIFIGEGIELMFDLEHRQPYCLSQHRLTMSHYQTLLESFKAITMYNSIINNTQWRIKLFGANGKQKSSATLSCCAIMSHRKWR